MKIRLIIIGFATVAFALVMWAADHNLSDSQMSRVWGGVGTYCDIECNLWGTGCDAPGGVNCYWTENKTVCNGTVEQGYCGQDEYHCAGDLSEGSICYQEPPNGEDCAAQTYEVAACHILEGSGFCGTIYPDDFSDYPCTGEIDVCWDE